MTSHRSTLLLAACTLLFCGGGCSSLKLSNFSPFQIGEDPMGHFSSPDLRTSGSLTEQAYHGVRQAKSQNSIVLEVVDDDEPVRVLPLPTDKTVYVSNLLEDTGVAKKLGVVEATLYRHRNDAIGGLPMEVRIGGDGQTVRPESDYALRAGDRLRVGKGTHPMLKGLVGSLLGL